MKNNGMIHIDNCPKEYCSWTTTSHELDTNINDETFKLYDPRINGRIVTNKRCKLLSITDVNEKKHEINLNCYIVEWNEGKFQRFVYIPIDKMNNFIVKKKLERLLDEI